MEFLEDSPLYLDTGSAVTGIHLGDAGVEVRGEQTRLGTLGTAFQTVNELYA